jgi:hypothetical protein
MSRNTPLNLGRSKTGPDVIVITNASTAKELCRLTTHCYTDAPLKETYAAVQRILHSVDTLPVVITALQLLVEKVDRAQQIKRSGGAILAEDVDELVALAQHGLKVVNKNKMLLALADAGYAVKASDLGGYFFSDEVSEEPSSDDFKTFDDALYAGYKAITAVGV